MKVGIIGLPNVGKSTLFKALTKKQVDASNYPFCTIDPNIGIVLVPDERLWRLAKISGSEKITQAIVEFVDIAGLVKNAHKGEGLGNQFLSHIREVDALVEVIRDFKDKNVVHVEGGVNPERDRDIIHLELVMADLQTVEKRLAKISKEAKSGDKLAIKTLNGLNTLKNILDQGNLASDAGLTDEEKILIRDLNLLTLKPVIYVLNIDEKSRKPFNSVQDRQETNKYQIPITNNLVAPSFSSDIANFIEIDAKLESELADLPDEEVKEYLNELGIERTGLDKLILESYKVLNLITFFTSGPKETRAWTIKKGTKAAQAAGKIHTDFEKGFIRAEVCEFEKYVEAKGELKAKEKGWVHLEGKEYVVKDGDVIYFRVSQIVSP